MDLGLNNRVAVVAGGASGIGRAVAEAFLAEGARVAIWDVAKGVEEVTLAVADSLRESGPLAERVDYIGLQVDVTDFEQVATAVAEVERRLGPIDHLVHAAAATSGKFGFPFLNLEPNDWRRVLEVNVMGMVNVAHGVAPGMQQRRSGSMLFVASVAGQIGSQTDPPYSASKAANINFAQCLAKDLAPHGVRVNTLCPGMVKTPLNRSVWQAWNNQQPAGQQRSYEDWADEKVRSVVPLGRWQEPREIGEMAVFLSSDRAASVTGQTINVDGGYVMHW